MNEAKRNELAAVAGSALRDASDVLRDDANQLARMLDGKVFDSMNYRVGIAVRTEMNRLRSISTALLALLPQEDDDD